MACQRADFGHSLINKITGREVPVTTAFWSIGMENIQSTAARSHANSTSHIKPRRAGVPCVRCRQMKVRSGTLSKHVLTLPVVKLITLPGEMQCQSKIPCILLGL